MLMLMIQIMMLMMLFQTNINEDSVLAMWMKNKDRYIESKGNIMKIDISSFIFKNSVFFCCDMDL